MITYVAKNLHLQLSNETFSRDVFGLAHVNMHQRAC